MDSVHRRTKSPVREESFLPPGDFVSPRHVVPNAEWEIESDIWTDFIVAKSDSKVHDNLENQPLERLS